MDIKNKLKGLVIERVNAEDWSGAVTLLDAIIQLASPSQTQTQSPPVTGTSKEDLKPQATDFDRERTVRMSRSE